MKTKPRLLSVSLAAVLSVSLLAVQPASALTVFDPSNFVQNTLTAVRWNRSTTRSTSFRTRRRC